MKRTLKPVLSGAITHRSPRLARCTLAILAGTAAARGFAQTPPGLPNAAALSGMPFGVPARAEQDPAQRLLQEQRDRQRRNEIQQPPAQIEVQQPTVVNLPEGADVETLPDVEPLFRIDHIDFIGDTVLGASALNEIAAPFIGKQLGRNRINLLLRRVTEAFIARGYITTRAYLGAQNLASGTLKINIVDGKVSAFTLNGKPLRPREPNEPWYTTHGGGLLTDAGSAWAFGDSRGDVLRLPDLEQGVDQINRLRRNQAEIQIMPGETPGDSVVAITNHYGDRVFYDLGIDNYGSSQTGTLRYRAGVEADNLIGLQESLSFNYVGTQDSNAVVFSAAAPYGYQTFSYTTSLSEYQQTISDVALLQGRTDAQMAANTGDLLLSSNGDLTVNGSAAQQQATLQADGNLSMTGAHVGISGYTINANGDVTSTGTIQSGGKLAVTAGANVNIANAQSNSDTAITGGANVTLGDVQTGGALAVNALGNDGAGDINLNGTSVMGGATSLQAARDVNVNGQTNGSTLQATAQRNVNVDAALQTSGDLALTATQGSVSADATVKSGNNLALTAGQNISVTAQATAQKAVSVASNGDVTLKNAAGSLTSTGNIQSGGNLLIDAAQSVDLGTQGTSALGDLTVNAGQNLTMNGSVVAQGNGTLTAGGTIAGAATSAFGLAASVSSGGDTNLTGSLRGGTVQTNAGGSAALRDVQAASSLALAATQDLNITGDRWPRYRWRRYASICAGSALHGAT